MLKKVKIKIFIVVMLLIFLTTVIYKLYTGEKVQEYITSCHAEKVINVGEKYSEELIAVSKKMEERKIK